MRGGWFMAFTLAWFAQQCLWSWPKGEAASTPMVMLHQWRSRTLAGVSVFILDNGDNKMNKTDFQKEKLQMQRFDKFSISGQEIQNFCHAYITNALEK